MAGKAKVVITKICQDCGMKAVGKNPIPASSACDHRLIQVDVQHV